MLLFGINMLEPNFAFVSPYLTNHQEMTTVHPGLPNTRHLYYIYLSVCVVACKVPVNQHLCRILFLNHIAFHCLPHAMGA